MLVIPTGVLWDCGQLTPIKSNEKFIGDVTWTDNNNNNNNYYYCYRQKSNRYIKEPKKATPSTQEVYMCTLDKLTVNPSSTHV